MDPGNWATDLEGGTRFGYRLLWVLVMSNAMAIFLQALSARLGVVAGRDLAQACRDAYPRPVSNALWVLCEIAIAACDLAEVLGAAIGLNLLLHIPLLAGILVTALDTLVLLWLQQFRIRSLELVVVRLIVIISACLGMEVFLARPETTGVLEGLIPRLDRNSLFTTIAILGATVMPHNLYLHSALVQSRRIGDSVEAKRKACRYNLMDTLVALNAAMIVNIAILVLAASVFFKRGIEVVEFQKATLLLEPLLGTKAASIIFAVALICAGQASTITGTMAGQIVMEGFLNLRMRAWLRRLFTRSIAIIPAAVTVFFAGDKGAYELLLLTQAVLSMQLPFALIPLIRFTGDRGWMGEFASRPKIQAAAWLVAIVNLMLNLWLARLKLVEWFAFEGVYGTAIAVVVIALLLGLVLLLLYVSFAPLRLGKGAAPDAERKLRPLFIDQVSPEEQTIEQLDALMTQLQGIAFIKDTAGKYVYFGAASSSALGHDPKDLLGRSDQDLWPAEIADANRQHDDLVLKQGQRYEGIEVIPRHGEPRSWFVMKFPIVERATQKVFLGGIGIDITDRSRSEQELRGLATRLQTVREDERAVVSREVHDLGQLLTALDLHLAMISQRLADGEDAGSLTGSLGAASEMLASTISSSARISRDLRPSTLDTLGLAVAIRWHAKEVASRSGMRLELGSFDHVTPEPDVSILVFRLFQGILAAIEAKGQPVEVHVSLRNEADRVALAVRARASQGARGEIDQLQSLDLIEMRELTLLYGGTVNISGTPGKGTTISVEVPCNTPFSRTSRASSE
jgi:NRAMP (natural resistance-associated macrophage protein)-like metal ion transporter